MKYFLLLFLMSCSIIPVMQRDRLVDSYVKEYEARSNCKVFIPIDFADFTQDEEGSKTVGLCTGFKQSVLFRRILLDKENWDTADSYEKEFIVLHELGHCVNDLDHDNTRFLPPPFDSRPTTIMNSHVFSEFKKHRDEYLDEFYKRANCR